MDSAIEGKGDRSMSSRQSVDSLLSVGAFSGSRAHQFKCATDRYSKSEASSLIRGIGLNFRPWLASSFSAEEGWAAADSIGDGGDDREYLDRTLL